ncbi:hypothetical protein MPSEU_000738500 [Mayamaea pseudoterrestris]|nr:hypothetical protein MPSEU_000738500 [Mayamaea pseudoterrestris]
MISIASASDDDGSFEQTMGRWRFPSLANACTSNACGAVLLGDDGVCMVNDDYEQGKSGASEQRRTRVRLITRAAQSIDSAVETVVDRLLPAKNTLLQTAANHTRGVREATASVTRSSVINGDAEDYKGSIHPACAGWTGVLDDAALLESIAGNFQEVSRPKKIKPSGGQVIKVKDKKEHPCLIPDEENCLSVKDQVALVTFTPRVKTPSETSCLSDNTTLDTLPVVTKKRNWLGWLRRKKPVRGNKRDSTGINLRALSKRVDVERFTGLRALSTKVDVEQFTGNASATGTARYIHDDECTLTKESASTHTIRIHRVPTDLFIAND